MQADIAERVQPLRALPGQDERAGAGIEDAIAPIGRQAGRMLGNDGGAREHPRPLGREDRRVLEQGGIGRNVLRGMQPFAKREEAVGEFSRFAVPAGPCCGHFRPPRGRLCHAAPSPVKPLRAGIAFSRNPGA
jgi:hypothetical protein